jgi:ubiquitin-like protein Pup
MREHVERRPHHHERGDDAPAAETVEYAPGAADLKADLDAILDEIDELLEDNAEEFVKAYVQKGGE